MSSSAPAARPSHLALPAVRAPGGLPAPTPAPTPPPSFAVQLTDAVRALIECPHVAGATICPLCGAHLVAGRRTLPIRAAALARLCARHPAAVESLQADRADIANAIVALHDGVGGAALTLRGLAEALVLGAELAEARGALDHRDNLFAAAGFASAFADSLEPPSGAIPAPGRVPR